MGRALKWLPGVTAIVAAGTLAFWSLAGSGKRLFLRVPGTDRAPGEAAEAGIGNPLMRGSVTTAMGKPSAVTGEWPRFRGANLSNISTQGVSLARQWDAAGPRKSWSIEVGEGYAGAAIQDGRVFLMDYDREKRQEALRCLSLDDGREIWRFSYPVSVKRNHGITRTVPAVAANLVVAMGAKGHVVCAELETGKLRWGVDLVREFGAEIPPWYTGQCPLIESNRVILAPGGPDALLLAAELDTGKVLWRTPNPRGWKMTHSSVVPVDFAGRRILVYCASGGVVGVDAADGRILWDTDAWKISIATIPCPVDLGGGRIFLTGGYNAGSLLVQLQQQGDVVRPEIIYRLKPEVFGATQHAPIFSRGHLFGVRADGRFVCLEPGAGKVVWASDPGSNFGLGAFMMAGDLIFALNDSGKLSLIATDPVAYRPLAMAEILKGPESWGPLAMAGGRLIARDLNQMVCLDVVAH